MRDFPIGTRPYRRRQPRRLLTPAGWLLIVALMVFFGLPLILMAGLAGGQY